MKVRFTIKEEGSIVLNEPSFKKIIKKLKTVLKDIDYVDSIETITKKD